MGVPSSHWPSFLLLRLIAGSKALWCRSARVRPQRKMTPQKPGDPDHPKDNRKSITTNLLLCSKCCQLGRGRPAHTFLKASVTSALLISILSTEKVFLGVMSSSRILGQRVCAQALLGKSVRVSISVEPTFLSSTLLITKRYIVYDPDLVGHCGRHRGHS